MGLLSIGTFVLCCFCPLGLFSLLPPDHMSRMGTAHTLSRDHMNRNDIVRLDCWSINIFSRLGLLSTFILIFGAFVLLGFCPLGFCPSPHVITWTEWGLPTPVPRDYINRNSIVHLNCWSIIWDKCSDKSQQCVSPRFTNNINVIRNKTLIPICRHNWWPKTIIVPFTVWPIQSVVWLFFRNSKM